MENKFTRKHINGLLSKDFSYETLVISSRYSKDYKYQYSKKNILRIDYPYNNVDLSLEQVEELHNYLEDLIEYHKNYDKNPTILTEKEKKEILFNKMKENEDYISLVLNKIGEHDINVLLDEIVYK